MTRPRIAADDEKHLAHGLWKDQKAVRSCHKVAHRTQSGEHGHIAQLELSSICGVRASKHVGSTGLKFLYRRQSQASYGVIDEIHVQSYAGREPRLSQTQCVVERRFAGRTADQEPKLSAAQFHMPIKKAVQALSILVRWSFRRGLSRNA